MKCDEAKPSCVRCTSTGRKCDGYRVDSAAQSGQQRSSLSLITSAVPDLSTDRERRAFDYYCQRSARVLTGTVDNGFWSSMVPRLSLKEPIVRHAVLALSSLHEHANLPDGGDFREANWRFGLGEYSKAVTLMRGWRPRTGESALLLPLLVCLLFVCIEFLLDDEASSHLHICQGRQMIADVDINREYPGAVEIIRDCLVPVYTRLCLASYPLGRLLVPLPEDLKISRPTPARFSSLDESRQLLHEIMDDVFAFSTAARPVINSTDPDPVEWTKLEAEQQSLLSRLSQWHTAITALRPGAQGFSTETSELPNEEPGRNLLMIVYHSMVIAISTSFQPTETAFDAHLPSFRAVVALVSSTVDISEASKGERDAFAFESELIPALHWVAIKCRHPQVRRDALDLLRREELASRKENLWMALECLVTGARVIEMEEWFSAQENGNEKQKEPPPLRLLQKALIKDVITSHQKPPLSASSMDESIANAQPAPTILPFSPRLSDFHAPFGIPERCRVSHIVVGPREKGGTWLTVFMAASEGSLDWKVGKEFIRWREA